MPSTPSHSPKFLKTHDRDRYLASLILPEKHRESIQALFAFNADIAAVPARVSEPAPGEIRLQWWHDTLEGAGHGEVRQNPIADEFLKVIDTYKLPVGPLLRLTAARRFDLYQDPMPDLETFEGYAGETSSVLYQYAAMILADGEELENGDAAGHLGVAHALIGHMRAFGFNAANGHIFLPISVFSAHGVTDQNILMGKMTPQIGAGLKQLREIAQDHLQKADTAIRQIPKSQRIAFAHISLLRNELKNLNKMANSFSPPHNDPDWRKIASLGVWALRST